MIKEWAFAVGISLLAFFAPIHGLLLAVFILLLIDVGVEIAATFKNKEVVVAKSLRAFVLKLIMYEIAIISSFLVSHFMMNDVFPIQNLIATVCGLIELKSILENLDKMSGEPIFKSIIRTLKKKEKDIAPPK